MNNSNTARYADIFAALGSEPRLEIMRLLFAAYPHGLTVGEIQSQLDIPSSTLSHHLEKLRVENLVSSRRQKQFLWYSANASTVEELLSFLYNGCSVSDSAPEREENYVAAIPEAEQLTESSQPATRNRFMFTEFLSLLQSFFSGIFDKFYLPRDFERFTPKAMQSLALAQNESRRLEHAYVGTEQLLLGLLEEGTGLAAQVMVRAGINAQDARREVEKVIGRGKGTPADIPFTPRAKRTLELAVAQARQLEHSHVGTEHLLLGVLQEGQGLGVRVLENLAIEPKNLEQQLRRMMNS